MTIKKERPQATCTDRRALSFNDESARKVFALYRIEWSDVVQHPQTRDATRDMSVLLYPYPDIYFKGTLIKAYDSLGRKWFEAAVPLITQLAPKGQAFSEAETKALDTILAPLLNKGEHVRQGPPTPLPRFKSWQKDRASVYGPVELEIDNGPIEDQSIRSHRNPATDGGRALVTIMPVAFNPPVDASLHPGEVDLTHAVIWLVPCMEATDMARAHAYVADTDGTVLHGPAPVERGKRSGTAFEKKNGKVTGPIATQLHEMLHEYACVNYTIERRQS